MADDTHNHPFHPPASPQENPAAGTHLHPSPDGPWHVVIINDPVNLMSYLVLVLRKVLGIDEDTARKHMMTVHEEGRSIVWTGLREKAEHYAFSLQQWHLNARIEPDEPTS
ncbi:Clp protease ClpS [Opitutaceae bacterium TAV4]|uniref:ATP-dependent Clp protease adaptor ClpS n=1 Tax=Geminisphaera colitermitum TaxID=1148786 RepID=UPI000158DA23|nr:ATP-dependent Clp protease adaptor ClpS [Geminisphaera colitermitum]RRJ96460.1 Clp protease ClpS [Opitutaceae bacterium TAV4]RRJ99800.1 Clp protease ClpS [Opitutaceae bacterium TAV3]